ncbi:phosphate ABC transporter substrate-binding protein [Shewanella sp. Choline-02u-19]|uniref:phosphate ABC transporter substrate-binding protein n=1 Tax=unclassified Shewanella TaxID=196818 RepID=UPI000C3222C2|nr:MULTISPECIES: phosphate ABC transporter substrate-binding protein [unclassified Shewanella]PKG56073.1 phosphate ABC transporter substrate-binding protein [Shewanella sp. GutDb-MelDb]PKG75569.1 phosphate ABC transporter substrate-binding protein [Shewanella sp. GutCb]PKH59998.1 phosphate ABC transporter substrate-binding protein [Shewanella sp. Bg11-22]PKI30679.1 phosphate ABC transporter substrate-binding protein [Shewanella sp. Choline-02u-19]
MKKVISLLTAVGLMVSPLVQAGTVTVSGSTSVAHVMEVLAENYQNTTKNNVEVQSTGSSAGIRAAKDGTSMIGMSSRNVKQSELSSDTKKVVIARDGIAAAVNNANLVTSLTQAQISKIYRGEIKNWSEVGGESRPIVVVTRENGSGTRGAFEEIMKLQRNINGHKVTAITPRAQVGNGNGMIKTIVANNPYAIGYISLGSVDDSLRAIDVDGVAATDDNIATGDYQIARPFIVLMDKNAPSNAQDFIKYILSEDGQNIVASEGYIRVQ